METTNPRFFPGNISGLGMTADDDGRKVDTRYGVHLDTTNGCLIEHPLAGDITLAYAVDGTLENTSDRVRALYLITPPMAAQIISELAGLLLRADPVITAALIGRMENMITPQSLPEEPAGEPAAPSPTDTLVLPADAADDQTREAA